MEGVKMGEGAQLVKKKTAVPKNKRLLQIFMTMEKNWTLICILENSLSIIQKLKHRFNPEIPLLGVFLRKMKIYFHTKTCIQMFIAVLLMPNIWWTEKQNVCLYNGTLFGNIYK